MKDEYTIRLTKDGTAWVAHTGVDLQVGIVGCGNTVKEALVELADNLTAD